METLLLKKRSKMLMAMLLQSLNISTSGDHTADQLLKPLFPLHSSRSMQSPHVFKSSVRRYINFSDSSDSLLFLFSISVEATVAE